MRGKHYLSGMVASQESIANEIRSIYEAIAKGIPAYSLKYSVKCGKAFVSLLKIKLNFKQRRK